MYGIQHYFPYDIQPTHDGKVSLTLEIDASHVRVFMTMLESLSDFFRVVNGKAKVALAYQKLPQNEASATKYYEEYKDTVIETYKQLSHETSENPRKLISSTLQYVKQNYPNASYDSVRDILSKSGELKKKGFYQKKV